MRCIVVPLVILGVLSACGPETPAESGAETACPITTPTRLVAAPEDFEPAEDAWYALYAFGDDILFTFDRFDDPAREYWRLDRCTGALEPYPSLAPGLHDPYMVDSQSGRVLYAHDDDLRQYVVDRFDEPGSDQARLVPGLPDGASGLPISSRPFALFYEPWTANDLEKRIFGAAGLGGATHGIYAHLGDPDVPARKISDQIIQTVYQDDTHFLVLEDSGEAHRIDLLTGERELVHTGVRHLEYSGEQQTFIWQAIGDDVVEPVYLHDLDTGEDLQIAVNDFAALSWTRDPDHRDLGKWVHTDDHNHAAMIGPGNRLVTAVRLDTGEAITVPEHLEQRGSFAGYFQLLLADGPEEIEALWDPRTGELREWYRGPSTRRFPLSRDGDIVEYFLDDSIASLIGSLWRVDLATGERRQILKDIEYGPLRVDETRYFTRTQRAQLNGPRLDVYSSFAHDLEDLAIVDTATGQSTPIVDRVSGVLGFPEEGLMFIDAFGDEPGLWAYPMPYSFPYARAAELGQQVHPSTPTIGLLPDERAAAWELSARRR